MYLKDKKQENIKSSKNEFRKKLKKDVKGITLIAFVVTIIVLLILAGVAINLTIGQNGVFQKAQDAANTWRNAETNEQLAMGELIDTVDKVTRVDGVPIPYGFYYVGGSKQTGLVISDNLLDAKVFNESTKNNPVPADELVGNQFVWIPVDNSSKENFNKVFQRQEGYYDGSKQSMLFECGEADGTGVNSKEIETSATQAEAQAMYNSVYLNGGFYVGRFEVGKDKNGKIVIKKGTEENPVFPFTNIKWSANGSMKETTETTGGAVEVSRNFYKDYNYTSVTSTLIYGVQWDAIMNFIDSNYITNAKIGTPNCDGTSFVRDSTDKGFYNHSLTTICGSSDDYRVNNIYDLAGNAFEWTMEEYSSVHRILRRWTFSFWCINAII